KELEEKISLIGPYSTWVQLDVMDRKFVPNKTFSNASKLKGIKGDTKIEVHLMIENPVNSIEKWLKSGAQRIIIHWESLGKNSERQFLKIHKKVRGFKKELGLAINPETPFEAIKPYISKVDLVLIMTVHPG